MAEKNKRTFDLGGEQGKGRIAGQAGTIHPNGDVEGRGQPDSHWKDGEIDKIGCVCSNVQQFFLTMLQYSLYVQDYNTITAASHYTTP